MATGARGEAIIETDDREVRVLFTNRAMAEAEKRLGDSKTIYNVIALGVEAGGAGVGDLAIVLAAGMQAARRDSRASSRPPSLRDAYALMDEVGTNVVFLIVQQAILEVVMYDRAVPTPEEDEGPNE